MRPWHLRLSRVKEEDMIEDGRIDEGGGRLGAVL
jgi:hypothetical protein